MKRFKFDPKKNPALFKLRIRVPQKLRLPHPELALPVETLMKTVRQRLALSKFFQFCNWLNPGSVWFSITLVTYLPPIESICDIFFKKFYKSEKTAAQGIMKYIHITLDFGVVIKAFHVIWNSPNCFTHITTHLGDFHSIQAHFSVIGSYVVWSRFKNIIYQFELCQYNENST